MAATSQVCSEVYCHPGGTGSSGFVLITSLVSLVYSACRAAGICSRLCWICLILISCCSSAANAASFLVFWVATRWILLSNVRYRRYSTISYLHGLVAVSAGLSGTFFYMVIHIMPFRIACFSAWKGGGATGYSGFLFDFSIRIMLATFIRFCVTISHCPSSSYLTSSANSFSSGVHLFFFHCTGSSLINFLPAKFLSLFNHCLFL